jgi:hypothetical protein
MPGVVRTIISRTTGAGALAVADLPFRARAEALAGAVLATADLVAADLVAADLVGAAVLLARLAAGALAEVLRLFAALVAGLAAALTAGVDAAFLAAAGFRADFLVEALALERPFAGAADFRLLAGRLADAIVGALLKN